MVMTLKEFAKRIQTLICEVEKNIRLEKFIKIPPQRCRRRTF